MVSCLRCVLLIGACATAPFALLDVQRAGPPPPADEVARAGDARPQRVLNRETNNEHSSMALSGAFQMMAAALPEGPTRDVMSRLKVCASCEAFQRFGERRDGGYLLCMDGLNKSNIRAAYSMGVEGHDKFSEDIYELLRIPVHQFDCTVAGPASPCADCHFNKVCLMGVNGEGGHPTGPNMNMQQILESTGQASAPEDSLVMKMDVEGAEWAIYAGGQSGLDKFKQLVFEFHGLNSTSLHPKMALALKNIEEAGFKVAHIHGNNCCGMYRAAGYSVPAYVEVTYVKNNPPLDACEAEQHPHPLDHYNVKSKKPLPMAHFP